MSFGINAAAVSLTLHSHESCVWGMCHDLVWTPHADLLQQAAKRSGVACWCCVCVAPQLRSRCGGKAQRLGPHIGIPVFHTCRVK